MSNIIPTTASEILPPRQSRAMGKHIARMNAGTDLRIRQVENEAEVQSGKVEAVGYVAKRAMFMVGSVTQTEQQVAQMVPMAATRLQAIGDIAAFAATEIVADMQQRIRRF